MSDLVEHPEDRFCRDEAHIINVRLSDWSLGAMLVQLDNNLEKITDQKTHTSGTSKLDFKLKFILVLAAVFTTHVLHCTYAVL